jgi:hypothetical protein
MPFYKEMGVESWHTKAPLTHCLFCNQMEYANLFIEKKKESKND